MSKTKAINKGCENTEIDQVLSDEQLVFVKKRARQYAGLLKEQENEYKKNLLSHLIDASAMPDFVEIRRPHPGAEGLARDKQRISAYFSIAMEKTVAQAKK